MQPRPHPSLSPTPPPLSIPTSVSCTPPHPNFAPMQPHPPLYLYSDVTITLQSEQIWACKTSLPSPLHLPLLPLILFLLLADKFLCCDYDKLTCNHYDCDQYQNEYEQGYQFAPFWLCEWGVCVCGPRNKKGGMVGEEMEGMREGGRKRMGGMRELEGRKEKKGRKGGMEGEKWRRRQREMSMHKTLNGKEYGREQQRIGLWRVTECSGGPMLAINSASPSRRLAGASLWFGQPLSWNLLLPIWEELKEQTLHA